MADNAVPHDSLLECLNVLANESLRFWDLPGDVSARLINVSENATYIVENSAGYRAILRVHRQGYHTRNAITCELEWARALNAYGGVITPGTIAGRDCEDIQEASVDGLPGSRYLVMFEFVEGEEPDENQDLIGPFEELGEIAAKTHVHSIRWPRRSDFERLSWNLETVFGAEPTWGDWRDAPGMDAAARSVMQRQEDIIHKRLKAFGTEADRYGLIHADMRLANLLIDKGSPRLIDFDDCGLGWFLYDFAAGISFMEDHPQVPAVKDAWVKGYRKIRPLSEAEEAEIDTFIMLRRMALCAWIGSHIETDTAQELKSDFVSNSVELAEHYLQRFA